MASYIACDEPDSGVTHPSMKVVSLEARTRIWVGRRSEVAPWWGSVRVTVLREIVVMLFG